MRPSTLPAALLAAGALAETKTTCASGLYIVVARGTGESSGTGAFGTIADDIADRVDGSIIEALDYPATFTDPLYNESEKDGVEEMQDVILDYHKACPNAKFAVLGYSQGGQVASDAFCGGQGGGFSELAPLSSDFVTSSFAAIILFGDPSHVANVTFDRGTSKNDGIFARDNVTFCEENYGDILRSFCDTGDVYCDDGDDSEVHGSYFNSYASDVVDFVVERYEKLDKSTTTSPSTTTASASSATSAASVTSASSATSATSVNSANSETSATSATSAASATSEASATASPSSDAGNAAPAMAPHLALVAAVPFVLAALDMVL
ncbi:hypothetical protein G7Z17_g4765 [Cylindrodendrum hubeiense]|uniref:Cutinase n=1 Tax=Cylindrodendrum hubeiense TaxID=595255 RepID=A0A9P5HDF5_9HYPO|nr:hypothetical protein G7Z17_g4765 [Cylindrodendrum hubeiense]